jgi:hypothetical protein
MFAAGAMLQIGLVVSGIAVALGAISLAGRRGGGRGVDKAAAPPPDPFAEPVAQRLPPEPPQGLHVGPASATADRRAVARAPVVRPVVIRRASASPGGQRTFALDVGIGGVLLAGPSDLAPGEVIELLLDLGEPVAGRGRVVRETPDGMKGVAFEALDADDRARLERYVAAAD